MLRRIVPATRYAFVVAVVCIGIAASVIFGYAAVLTGRLVVATLQGGVSAADTVGAFN